MSRPLHTERLLAATFLPGEIHEDFTQSPSLVVELSAFVPSHGVPAYQVVISDMTRRRTAYKSCFYASSHFACTEYARETGVWLPESVFEGVV